MTTTQLLRRITARFGVSPAAINEGQCQEWAWAVKQKVPEAEVWETDWDQSPICHYFVKIGKKFYDAEASSGVRDWKLLPLFLQEPGTEGVYRISDRMTVKET